MVETQIVGGRLDAELRGQIEVDAAGEQAEPGVHEVRLPLVFAAAQVRDQAAAVHQRHAGAGQQDAETVPEAEAAAGEGRVVEDAVEAVGGAVGRVAVAGGIEIGDPGTPPVAVERHLERRHAGEDVDLVVGTEGRVGPGDRVEAVGAGGEVEGVVDVDPAEVAEAGPAEIERAHRVRRERAHRVGAHQEAVGVEVEAGLVAQVVERRLRGVARHQEVLAVDVGHRHLLVAGVEGVEAAVGVLLQPLEERQVELVAVRLVGAEEARAEVGVGEEETAEVAVERLDAGAHRDEVVVRGEVGELQLAEQLLHRDEAVRAAGALAHVGVDDAVLGHAQVVDVRDEARLDPPVDRPEGGVALEQVGRQGDGLGGQELPVTAEELQAPGPGGADPGGGGQLAGLDQGVRDRAQAEEQVLAADRQIALPAVLVVGVPAAAGDGQLVGRQHHPPAVGEFLEIAGGRLDRRRVALRHRQQGTAREAARKLHHQVRERAGRGACGRPDGCSHRIGAGGERRRPAQAPMAVRGHLGGGGAGRRGGDGRQCGCGWRRRDYGDRDLDGRARGRIGRAGDRDLGRPAVQRGARGHDRRLDRCLDPIGLPARGGSLRGAGGPLRGQERTEEERHQGLEDGPGGGSAAGAGGGAGHCSGLRGNLRNGRRTPSTKRLSAQMPAGGRKPCAPRKVT